LKLNFVATEDRIDFQNRMDETMP